MSAISRIAVPTTPWGGRSLPAAQPCRSQQLVVKASKLSAARTSILCLVAALALSVPASPNGVHAQGFSRLELVSGDRQIVTSTMTPPRPYQVRALDAAGNPVPGVTLYIGPGKFTGAPMLTDEFGFRGFNAYGFETWLGPLPHEYIAVTDRNGIATARGTYRDYPPSASMIAAASLSGPWYTLPHKFFSVVMTAGTPAGDPAVVVEFFHADTRHYFNTIAQDEIDLLESGHFSGWSRSIGAFVAYATARDAPPGAVPVCRFFSSRYTTHFYTADPTECEIVLERWPDVWTLETRTAFWIQEPDKGTGACAAGLLPVYRLYSTRAGPNHRYVTDAALRDVMVAAGWVAEGYGPDAVMLCTPR